MIEIKEEDIEVINLNEINEYGGFPCCAKKPNAILIWNDITPEQAKNIKQQILANQKLRQLVEERIKHLQNITVRIDEFQYQQEINQGIDLLQSLLDEVEK